jgi:peptidoglycan hydrolase-like protein with peptidoglycan-binding domain
VDGVYGSETERRVRTFQDSWGLVIDGIAGRGTWSHFSADKQGWFKGSAQRLGELTNVGELTRRRG